MHLFNTTCHHFAQQYLHLIGKKMLLALASCYVQVSYLNIIFIAILECYKLQTNPWRTTLDPTPGTWRQATRSRSARCFDRFGLDSATPSAVALGQRGFRLAQDSRKLSGGIPCTSRGTMRSVAPDVDVSLGEPRWASRFAPSHVTLDEALYSDSHKLLR